MPRKTSIPRRHFLKISAMTAGTAAAFPALLSAANVSAHNKPSPDFHADVEIELTQFVDKLQIFDGPKTRVWKIRGKVLQGSPDCVANSPDTYLAPTLYLQSGQKIRIILHNALPAMSILHWHGLHVPADMDGNPMFAIHHGETFVYEFELLNRAGTYWYHAHTHSVTARQVYSGLAGLIIVSDPQEQALNLPSGQYDVPLVIQDRSFDRNNQLAYMMHPMQRMNGFLGDQIMINGRPDFVLPVETRSYRLRLLNGSNSRIYKLAWDHGIPVTVIGTDGGLLERPYNMPYVMLAPGQRRELWVDFSNLPLGSRITLHSEPFEAAMMHGGMMGGMGRGMMGGRHGGMRGNGHMGGGMMGRGVLPQGGRYPVLHVKISKKSSDSSSLPARLVKTPGLLKEKADNLANPHLIKLSMRHMSALLNGRSYKMHDVRPDEIIPVNTLRLMAFDNGFHGSHGMTMPHPMHLHGEQFQILKRDISPRFEDSQASVAEGLVDQGRQDTVLVMPGEKVTFLKPFNDFKGLFMYHCHNLEHEDMGMMRDFLIE